MIGNGRRGTAAAGGHDAVGLLLVDRFAPSAWLLAAVVGLGVVTDALAVGGRPIPAAVATATGSCVLLAALAAAATPWRGRRPGYVEGLAAHAWGLVATVVTLDIVLHLSFMPSDLFVTLAAADLLVAGAVLPLRRWLLVVEALHVTACLVGSPLGPAAVRLPEPLLLTYAFTVIFVIPVAHLLQQLAAHGRRQVRDLTTELARQAECDPLTGLLNRRGLLAGCAGLRTGGDGEAGVLCLDLDGFKGVNDELGHDAGDALLLEVAERLCALVGPRDVVARTGGDEFVVVLAGGGREAAARLAHQLRIRLSGTIGVLHLPWAVSIGVAGGPAPDAAALAGLLRAADLAMYDDKRDRRASARARRLEGRPVGTAT